ncbi:MAG: TlpA disulfide reductase family protein [Alistipes sp.]
MKKILILCLAAISLYSCTSNKCVVNGNIAGLEGTLYLFDETGTTIDSTTVEKGQFEFKMAADTARVNYLGTDLNTEQPFTQVLFIEPGKIAVNGTLEAPHEMLVTGTPTNEANTAFSQSNSKLAKRYDAEGATKEERAAVKEEYTALARKTMDENMSNHLGVLILTQQLAYEMSGAEMLEVIAKFPAALQQGKQLTKLKEQAQVKQKTEVGQPYIDIVQNNPAGEAVSLKSVIENPANKYVLVDFWASWCHPCMGEVPYLTTVYADYHKKGFEIYGISFDVDKAPWMEVVNSKKMNWIHVSDLKRFDNQAARDYAVQGIPSNFLIDTATGTIIAVNLRGEALGEKIAELLK